MIEKIDANQIQSFLEKTPSRKKNDVTAFAGNDAEVSVQVDYATLIEKAIKAPKTDSDVIEHTKKLLLSGQLESSENIQKATENILNFGI